MANRLGVRIVSDVQGNVLRGYGVTCTLFVFLEVTTAAAARRSLGALRVTGDEVDGDHTLNLAFTHGGLLALGVPPENVVDAGAFAQGMAARSAALGDVGPSAPEHWLPGIAGTHVLAILGAWQPEVLREQRQRLLDTLEGLEVGYERHAATLPGGREHFGFSDGFSQPAVPGSGQNPRDGEGTVGRWGRWRELALGEFVLGHDDEGGARAPGPSGPLGEQASFMVVRQLEQDVAAFRRYTADTARELGRTSEWLAAKLVGRWQNGSSLVRNPDEPGPDAAADARNVNRFRYGGDPHGRACPLGAHVRRANPRDALGWQGRLTKRHRIVRRGMSYGEPLRPGALEDDDRERGLMFVCYQASIERQFELIQQRWISDGDAFGLGGDSDPLVGSGSGLIVQGRPPHVLSPLPRFVTTRGGEYFLLPGLTGLDVLLAGRC